MTPKKKTNLGREIMQAITKKQGKTSALQIRLSPDDHTTMKAVAANLDISVAEYLTQLHHLAQGK